MRNFKIVNLLILIISLTYINAALAGGLILYEIATPDAALCAAGLAARAQDASTAQSNPAGMTRLKGKQLMSGAQLLISDFGFDASYPGTTNTGGNGGNPIGLFPGASLFYVHPLGEDWRFGLAAFGNFGSALHYDSDWVGRYFTQTSVLLGITAMPSLAYQICPQWSVGVGLNAMIALFQAKTAINTPLDAGDGEVKFKDVDLGLGGQFSLMFKPSCHTRFGLVYNSEIDLKFSAIPQFSNLGALGAILQSNGVLGNGLSLEMTVPAQLMLSLFHDLNARWAVLSSTGWQNWSRFGDVGIQLDNASDTSIVVNRKYKDTWHGSLGFQYQASRAWLLSSGMAYDSSMEDPIHRTPGVPVGQTWRWGLGAQYRLDGKSSLHLCYTLNWIGNMDMEDKGGILTGNLEGVYRHTALHFVGISYQKVL